MTRQVREIVAAAIAGAIAIGTTAGLVRAQPAAMPEVLPCDCEIALALSAAPPHLQLDASVYALTAGGYVLERQGTNAFTCIVNRDDPRVLKPTCFDAEGTRTVIPTILYFGDRMLAGVPTDSIREEVKEKFASGELESQAKPGVAYMLSRYNRPVNPSSGDLGFFPPHVMFHAPNLTNEDIGHDMAHHDVSRPLPMIGYQGPQGYMIMISDDGTPRSRSDLPQSCPDWIFE